MPNPSGTKIPLKQMLGGRRLCGAKKGDIEMKLTGCAGLFFCIILLFSCTTTDQRTELSNRSTVSSYEPKQIFAETNKDVMLYFAGMDVGFTAIKTNTFSDKGTPQELIIKSSDSSKFTIKNYTSCTLNEAIDKNNNVTTHLVVNYSIRPDSITKLNNGIVDNKISFIDLINSISEDDLYAQQDGSSNPPDLRYIDKIRQAFVYNIAIQTSKNEEIILQVFVEKFMNAKDL